MKRKSLFIPILVFVLSFSALSIYQKSHSTVVLASTTSSPSILWSKKASDIPKLIYATKDTQIVVKREDNNWFLINNGSQKADDLYIYNTINTFLEPQYEEIVSKHPNDLSTYGINDSSPTLTLYDNENNLYSLVQGSTVDDALSYVYVKNLDTLYTMKTVLFESLSLSSTDWLDKQLLRFELEDVRDITFTYKNFNTTLTPTTNENNIIFSSAQVNQELCTRFIDFLKLSKIEQFITHEASPHILATYGFDKPSLSCTVHLQSGENLSLVIGQINREENICYARVNNSLTIVTIPYFDFSQFDTLFAQLEQMDALTIG